EGSAAAGQAAKAQSMRPATSDSNRRSPNENFRILVTSTDPPNLNGCPRWPQTTAISRTVPVPPRQPFHHVMCNPCAGRNHSRNQLTPSFFCRLEEDVVYWNTSRFSG